MIALCEREQAHRHATDSEALRLEGDSDRGAQKIERESRWLGGIVLGACIAAALYCATIDKEWVAAAFLGVPVMTAVGILIHRRKDAQK